MKLFSQYIKFRLNHTVIFKLLFDFVIFAHTDPAVSSAGNCSTWWLASFPVLQPCSLISSSTCRTPLRTTNIIIKVEEPHDSPHPDMPKINDDKHMNTISESLQVTVMLHKGNRCSYSHFCSQNCLIRVWIIWSDLLLLVVAVTFLQMQRLGPFWQVNWHQTINRTVFTVSNGFYWFHGWVSPGWPDISRNFDQAARRSILATPDSTFRCNNNLYKLLS